MKTRLYTRKRALISSVAMLLVAMIALGTATFAWFTKSTSTSATGLNVTTVKSSELQISKSDHVWQDTQINYAKSNEILKPATSANGLAWFQAEAELKTASTAKDGTIASATGNYVIKDQLNVKNAVATGGKNMRVTITVTGLTSEYGRVALVPATDGTVTDGVSAMKEGAKFTDNLFDTEGETVQAFTDTNGTTAEVAATTGCTVTIDSLAPQSAEYFNLYVWFEGQDADCFDTNAGVPIGNITINVSGETLES